MHEVNSIAKIVTESVDTDAKIIFGTIHDANLKKGEVKVTVIATGFQAAQKKPSTLNLTQVPIQRSTSQPINIVEKQREPEPVMDRPVIKRPVEKAIEEVSDDDYDDNIIPAFLRRSKK